MSLFQHEIQKKCQRISSQQKGQHNGRLEIRQRAVNIELARESALYPARFLNFWLEIQLEIECQSSMSVQTSHAYDFVSFATFLRGLAVSNCLVNLAPLLWFLFVCCFVFSHALDLIFGCILFKIFLSLLVSL